METKVCPTCKTERPVSEYFKAKGKPDGLQSCCKECHKQRMKSYQSRLQETEREIPESKFCSGCKTVKPAEEFAKAKNQVSGLAPWCRVCMRNHRKVKRDDDPRRFLLHAAKHRAKIAGLPFDLKMDDIAIPMFCPVLGIQLQISEGYQRDTSPSIDKIKPALGYVKENVVVVSWKANRIKGDATAEELRKVADFYSKL
jgi:hypothetical protein